MQTSTPNPIPEILPPAALDLGGVKAKQQATWSTGDFARIGTLIHASAERLVETADLQAGWQVLDVATGSGNAALAAARMGCEAVGVDYVPALLDRARIRAAAEQLDARFELGDAERLPFADASFDAVVSIFGVMFAPDQRRAAAELLRVVRPGGRIALGNWTPDGFVGQMFRLLSRHVPPPAGVEPPILWGTRERLEELFDDEVASLEIRRSSFVFRFRSPEEFVAVFGRWFGPLIKALELVGERGAPALEAELAELVRTWNRNPGNPVAVPGEYLEVVAARR